MAGKLDDKVVFITGAARGQGRSHAIRLAENGAKIIAIDVCTNIPGTPYPGTTPADLDDTVRLVEKVGGEIIARAADVRSSAEIDGVLADAVREFGGLDIVVANAGIVTSMSPAEDMSEDTWATMIDINLSGVWRTVKSSVPHLKKGAKGGSVILTSSAAGLRGYLNNTHYVAAKHGVVGLVRAFALELAPFSIRVNSVHPTQVDTEMIQNEMTYKLFVPQNDSPSKDDFAAVSQALQALPIPWVEPVDISNAVLFLASDEARYITGVTLPVDAGSLLL